MLARIVSLSILSLMLAWHVPTAIAMDLIVVHADEQPLDLLPSVEFRRSNGDEISVFTAPAADGIVRGLAVKAITRGSAPDWMVFALRNDTDKPLTRWLVSFHKDVMGEDFWLGDISERRIVNLSSSLGTPPRPVASPKADIFEVTIEPGASVTYVAELAGHGVANLILAPQDYYLEMGHTQALIKAAVLAATGFLSLFLTVLALRRWRWNDATAAVFALSVTIHLLIQLGYMDAITLPTEPLGNGWHHLAWPSLAGGIALLLTSQLARQSRWQWIVVSLFSAIAILLAGLSLGWIRFPTSVVVMKSAIMLMIAIALGVYSKWALARDRSALHMLPTIIVLSAWLIVNAAISRTDFWLWWFQSDLLSASLLIAMLALTITKSLIATNDHRQVASSDRVVARSYAASAIISAISCILLLYYFSGLRFDIVVKHDLEANYLGLALESPLEISEQTETTEPKIQTSAEPAEVTIKSREGLGSIKADIGSSLDIQEVETQIQAASPLSIRNNKANTAYPNFFVSRALLVEEQAGGVIPPEINRVQK